MRRKYKLLYLIAILFLLTSFICPMKVSEWTMLNFEPSDYKLRYYCKDKCAQTYQKLNTSLKNANINFKSFDVQTIDDIKEKTLYNISGNKSLPFYALFNDNRLFASYNSVAEMKGLSNSPLRKKIADMLKAGNLYVILYLKTGDKFKDEKGAKLINKYLSESRFKDIIPVVNLSRHDKVEKTFVKLLLKVEHDLAEIKEPMLFGIFGRFRVMEPLVGNGISNENINYLTQFLTADCSCLIKEQMPGIDMLYINDWENPSPALLNKILDE